MAFISLGITGSIVLELIVLPETYRIELQPDHSSLLTVLFGVGEVRSSRAASAMNLPHHASARVLIHLEHTIVCAVSIDPVHPLNSATLIC